MIALRNRQLLKYADKTMLETCNVKSPDGRYNYLCKVHYTFSIT